MHFEEVDELSGAVDFGLDGALALAQHGRGVQVLSVLGCHEVGCSHPNVEALFDRGLVPCSLCLHGHVYGFLDEVLIGVVILGYFLFVIMWLKREGTLSTGLKLRLDEQRQFQDFEF